MKDVKAAIEWYREKKPLYEMLANKVASIIRENLEQTNINYHSVTCRPKEIDSFATKAQNEKYKDPANEIKDMAGIRIITYLESDVNKVAKVVENIFAIDKLHSFDQSSLLGSDKVGYRSVHYVATLDPIRCQLPEYKSFTNLPFEIQIRSLLQHAWAEIEHDKSYKFTGQLPTEIHRRFYLVAGMLEVADREFVAIAEKINEYKSLVTKGIKKDDLDIEVNSISINEYLLAKFSKLIKKGLLSPEISSDTMKILIEELQLFGIKKISQLDAIITSDYQRDQLAISYRTTIIGLIRDLLIINNPDKYFKVSWRNSWSFMFTDTYDHWKRHKVDVDKYMKKYDLEVSEVE